MAQAKRKPLESANAEARSSRSEVARKGGKAGDCDDWSKERPMSRAREIGIEGRSRMNRDELIRALRNH